MSRTAKSSTVRTRFAAHMTAATTEVAARNLQAGDELVVCRDGKNPWNGRTIFHALDSRDRSNSTIATEIHRIQEVQHALGHCVVRLIEGDAGITGSDLVLISRRAA